MYSAFRQICERILRLPPEPEPPPGDEAQTKIFRAAPRYYNYLLAIWALKTAGVLLILFAALAAPIAGVFITVSRGGSRWAFLILILPGIVFLGMLIARLFALTMVRLDFDRRWYVVTDRSLRVREGIWLVREATVTFANIQNISISQGPIQRALGITDLRVDTAGGGGDTRGNHSSANLHTVWFRGVDNANEIRELMQQRLRQLKDSGLGDHEELAAPSPPGVSASWVAALQQVCAEAGALRETVARRTKTIS